MVRVVAVMVVTLLRLLAATAVRVAFIDVGKLLFVDRCLDVSFVYAAVRLW